MVMDWLQLKVAKAAAWGFLSAMTRPGLNIGAGSCVFLYRGQCGDGAGISPI